MVSVMESLDLADRASFDLFTEERLRIADLDMNGHVNNVAVIQLMENARNLLLATRTPLTRGPKRTFMLVRFEVDFRGELFHPGAPEAACRLLKLGSKSLTLGQAVFDGARATATGQAVIVNVDRITGRATPFSVEARAALEALLPS
ncbi:Acyl-CoA thioesterase FadM [Albimonas donghaensis]|uniref:Acyl-CoA thioesterase FadM n=2 Tax=Albimonas donghaensis TaxID=356660 RepID=A0A1H3DU32_9RHOB|nr:Acyl-CoA thioesterase FadM [Albimonas donghaensis]